MYINKDTFAKNISGGKLGFLERWYSNQWAINTVQLCNYYTKSSFSMKRKLGNGNLEYNECIAVDNSIKFKTTKMSNSLFILRDTM